MTVRWSAMEQFAHDTEVMEALHVFARVRQLAVQRLMPVWTIDWRRVRFVGYRTIGEWLRG